MDEPAQPVVELPQDKQALLRHLEKTNPEALALAHDWDDVAYNVMKSKAKLERYVYNISSAYNRLIPYPRVQSENPSALSLSMMHLHYRKCPLPLLPIPTT